MLYSRSMAMHEIGFKKKNWHNVRKDKEFGMIHRNTTKVEISRLKDSIRWIHSIRLAFLKHTEKC